ncbi:MAG: hypothetical protein DRP62_01120 [Planctomycetota bacterium]|nr:MAG: hypothetical protein DRP62_01120 [Planctomycetota bacterium]
MIMPAIVQFPKVVEEALEKFGSFFANEPERKHFAEYITGLIIANKKKRLCNKQGACCYHRPILSQPLDNHNSMG